MINVLLCMILITVSLGPTGVSDLPDVKGPNGPEQPRFGSIYYNNCPSEVQLDVKLICKAIASKVQR